MISQPIALALTAAGAALVLTGAAWAAEQPAKRNMAPAKTEAKAGGDAGAIASAMAAAPPGVGRHATIVAMDAKGGMRTLRKGTNGFTCLPDDPQTPGPDPMCADANAMAWISAMMAKQPPPQKAGFMYMLAGGTDASNTDPYATKPTKGNHWIKTGPHVMIVGDAELLKGYPASPDPNTSAPYVMWAGTPYAHLMAPVR